MREFFHGWRRKIGVVTLILACVFVAGWVRSLFTADTIQVPGMLHQMYSIDSEFGAIQFLKWEGNVPAMGFWSSSPLAQSGLALPLGETGQVIFSGQEVIAEGTGVTLPYWSIVVPLTLVSAWLLLSKPRPPKKNVRINEAK